MTKSAGIRVEIGAGDEEDPLPKLSTYNNAWNIITNHNMSFCIERIISRQTDSLIYFP